MRGKCFQLGNYVYLERMLLVIFKYFEEQAAYRVLMFFIIVSASLLITFSSYFVHHISPSR